MPDAKVYISVENLDKWNALANKSEWINEKLSGVPAGAKIASGKQRLEISRNYKGSGGILTYFEYDKN